MRIITEEHYVVSYTSEEKIKLIKEDGQDKIFNTRPEAEAECSLLSKIDGLEYTVLSVPEYLDLVRVVK